MLRIFPCRCKDRSRIIRAVNSSPDQRVAGSAGLFISGQPDRPITAEKVSSPATARASDSIPAIILWDGSTANLKVAGLTLLDRLVVSACRAGCHPIIVAGRAGSSSNPEALLERAKALKIPFRFASEIPWFEGPALVASSGVLVATDDLRELIRSGGRLLDADGKALPVGVTRGHFESVDSALAGLSGVRARRVARYVPDAAAAREAARALWSDLKGSSDGLVDRFFNRPCGRPLSRLLAYTSVSPNTISLASTAIGVIAAGLFTAGDYMPSLLAAVLFQLSAIVDCVDGDIARIGFKESVLGKWIDLVGDQVVHVSVFGGIAVGLTKAGSGQLALWLGLSAIAGAVLSFAVVVRGLRRARPNSGGRLQRLIDSATNRDFSVLVLALAAVGRLDWFLWLTAVGSHLFWITALAVQTALRPVATRAG